MKKYCRANECLIINMTGQVFQGKKCVPSTEMSWIAKRRMMVQIIPRVIFTLPSTISAEILDELKNVIFSFNNNNNKYHLLYTQKKLVGITFLIMTSISTKLN